MPLRDGQQRVEIRPGVFVWMNDRDYAAHQQRQADPNAGVPITSTTSPVESAAVAPAEAAVIGSPQARPARRRQ